MALWQVDCCKRVAFSDNPSGFYYWTSVYYLESSDFSNAFQARQAVINLDKILTTTDVEIVRLQVHAPPGRGNVIFNGAITFTFGQLSNPGGLYSLINVARWHLFDDAGRRSYRLNRMPLRPSDIDGDHLSATGASQQLASLNTLLLAGWCRNSYGELLTSGDVVQRLTMWQLRHGTKRRERNPLT